MYTVACKDRVASYKTTDRETAEKLALRVSCMSSNELMCVSCHPAMFSYAMEAIERLHEMGMCFVDFGNDRYGISSSPLAPCFCVCTGWVRLFSAVVRISRNYYG